MMDLDGEEGGEVHGTRQKHKRGKANSGATIARKGAPRSNRQLAGMRDEAVRGIPSFYFSMALMGFLTTHSKYPKRRDYGISVSVSATCLRKRARATALSESKWCVSFLGIYSFGPTPGHSWTRRLRSFISLFHLFDANVTFTFHSLHYFSRSISFLGSERQARPTADEHRSSLRQYSSTVLYILIDIVLLCSCTFHHHFMTHTVHYPHYSSQALELRQSRRYVEHRHLDRYCSAKREPHCSY